MSKRDEQRSLRQARRMVDAIQAAMVAGTGVSLEELRGDIDEHATRLADRADRDEDIGDRGNAWEVASEKLQELETLVDDLLSALDDVEEALDTSNSPKKT